MQQILNINMSLTQILNKTETKLKFIQKDFQKKQKEKNQILMLNHKQKLKLLNKNFILKKGGHFKRFFFTDHKISNTNVTQ